MLLLYYLNKTNKGVNTKEKYINGIEIKYLFETDKQSIKKYYQMKNKQGLSFFTLKKNYCLLNKLYLVLKKTII